MHRNVSHKILVFRPQGSPIRSSSQRLEVFTDGIFSIVITVGIIRLHVPSRHDVTKDHLWEKVEHEIPMLLAHMMTVLVVGLFWAGNSIVFSKIKRVDRKFTWRTIFYLLAVAFLPFGTSLVGVHPNEPEAYLIYGANVCVGGYLMFVTWKYGYHNLAEDVPATLDFIASVRIVSSIVFGGLAVISSFISTKLAIAVFIIYPLTYVMSSWRIDPLWNVCVFLDRRLRKGFEFKYFHPPPTKVSSERLKGFGDAVFCIVITLIAIEIPIPKDEDLGDHTLTYKLWEMWPDYAAYAVAGLATAIFWSTHMFVYSMFKTVDRWITWLNQLYLGCITLIPFSGRLMGEFPGHPAGIMFYGVNCGIAGGLIYIMVEYGHRNDHMYQKMSKRGMFAVGIRSMTMPTLNIVSAVISYWNIYVSYAIIGFSLFSYVLFTWDFDVWIPLIQMYQKFVLDNVETVTMNPLASPSPLSKVTVDDIEVDVEKIAAGVEDSTDGDEDMPKVDEEAEVTKTEDIDIDDVDKVDENEKEVDDEELVNLGQEESGDDSKSKATDAEEEQEARRAPKDPEL